MNHDTLYNSCPYEAAHGQAMIHDALFRQIMSNASPQFQRCVMGTELGVVDATIRPSDTDVLLGRGVGTNRHPGNENFRSIVSQHVAEYVIGTKKQKMNVSRSIVDEVRTQLNPPGRFLEKDPRTGLWREVDLKRALAKTAQALRDGAHPLRVQLVKDMTKPSVGGGASHSPAPSKSSTDEKKRGRTNTDMSEVPSSECRPPSPKKHRSDPGMSQGAAVGDPARMEVVQHVNWDRSLPTTSGPAPAAVSDDEVAGEIPRERRPDPELSHGSVAGAPSPADVSQNDHWNHSLPRADGAAAPPADVSDDEFAREMGPDERFLGLGDSSPIADAFDEDDFVQLWTDWRQ